MNRSKLELIYSIVVIAAIPLIVIANTIFITQNDRKAFDLEIQRKADITNNVVAEVALGMLSSQDYEGLSGLLDNIEADQPAYTQSTVLVKDGDEFKIVARSDSASDKVDQNEALFAYTNHRSIAKLINFYDENSKLSQAWSVTTPIMDDQNEAVALVSSKYLTASAQQSIDNSYKLSFVALLISLLLIVFMLFRHFRLVGYIQLLAKQKEVNQTMSDFLSVATHELRAPTTIIKGYLSEVLEDNNTGEDAKKNVGVALSQTERLNSLVQDLLNVSRVDQGKIQYDIQPIEATKIIDALVQNYRPIAKEKGIEIDFQPEQTAPQVMADAGRFQEIFTNLIDNAIKYTEKGRVEIGLSVTKNSVTFNVRDTGFGMSPEARERLFQRFYRIKTDKTKDLPGTGLGLWIIKQYVEAMGGKISVETMENVGSNFIVELKRAK